MLILYYDNEFKFAKICKISEVKRLVSYTTESSSHIWINSKGKKMTGMKDVWS